jgi:hypothetical protein
MLFCNDALLANCQFLVGKLSWPHWQVSLNKSENGRTTLGIYWSACGQNTQKLWINSSSLWNNMHFRDSVLV